MSADSLKSQFRHFVGIGIKSGWIKPAAATSEFALAHQCKAGRRRHVWRFDVVRDRNVCKWCGKLKP